MSDFLFKLQQRSDVRLAAFGLSVVAAVYFGFIGVAVGPASLLVENFGYYFMLVTFALWVTALWHLWRQRNHGKSMTPGEWLAVLLAVGLLSLVAITAEPFRSKILYDEFSLQSTAYNMHHFREAVGMVRGYDILGVFMPVTTYLDKRPNFFPFLISLVHDLTGYRSVNAYWLNAVLLPITLGLGYFLGRRLQGPRGGLLVVLLLGSLPLLMQNATGSSMELLNVTMILAVAALATAYLRQPDEVRISALVLATVLLAQTRYESALYVAPVALIILLGWWQRGRIILSWSTIVVPLLLLPAALQNKILSNSPWMWELRENRESRFSFDYLTGNLRGAREFFLCTTARLANSWPLTVLGFMALGYLCWRLLSKRPSLGQTNPDHLALGLLGFGAVVNTVLIMFYYWSSFADPIASRFSLPFHLVLAFSVVMLAARLDRIFPATLFLLGSMTVFALSIAASHQAQHLYSHLGIDEIEWEKRYVVGLPVGERLIISNESPLPWLMMKMPSILISRARVVGDRLKYTLDHGTFREILVLQSLRPTTIDGNHELVPEDRLPSEFDLEVMTEKRFGTKIVRVSRLLKVNQSANGPTAATTIP